MASSVIGALRVMLGMDTAEFESGASRATRSMQSMERKFQKIGADFQKIGLGITAAITAPVLGAAAAFTRSADQMARDSRAMATSAEIAGEGFEEFQRQAFAASKVGIEFEKLGDQFKDVRERVGEFVTTGGGPLQDAFDALNGKVKLTVDELRGLSGKDALQLIVDRMQQAKLSTEEMSFVLESLASDTTQLLPLLRDGGKAFEELGKNATFITEADREKFNQYVTAQERMGEATKALTIALVGSGLLDAMVDLAQRAAAIAERLSKVSPETIRLGVAMGALAAAVGPVLVVFGSLVSRWASILPVMASVAAGLVTVGSQAGYLAVSAARTTAQVGLLAGAKTAWVGITSAASAAMRGLLAAMVANPFTTVAVAVGSLASAMLVLGQRQREARAETDNLIRSLRNLAQARSADFAFARNQVQMNRNNAYDELTRTEMEIARLQRSPEMAQRPTAGARLRSLQDKARALRWDLIKIDGELVAADRAFAAAGQAAEQMTVPTAQAAQAIGGITRASGGAGGALRSVAEGADALRAVLARAFPEAERYRSLLEDFDVLARGGLSPDELAEARVSLLGGREKKAIGILGNSNGPLSEAREVEEAAERVADAMRDNAAKTEVQTVRIARSFADMARDAMQSLNQLVNAIKGGGFFDILDGIIGFGLQLGQSGVFGGKIAGALNNVPRFANGGAMTLGGYPGIDTNLLSLNGSPLAKVSRGETMAIRPANDRGDQGRIDVFVHPSGEFDTRVTGVAARVVAQSAPAIAQQGAGIAMERLRTIREWSLA